jgi:hypothetical protein
MKKLLKHIVYTASLLMFATQASAFVSKGFIPANVSQIHVIINDYASDGCWTNIGEVKRYAEDKLELVGFKILRDKYEGSVDDRHYVFNIVVNSKRGAITCFGDIQFSIVKYIQNNNMGGMFLVGQYGNNFTGAENANQFSLKTLGNFMKEVEAPQW